MRNRWPHLAVNGAILFFCFTANAHALCIYNGKLDAKTTITQEFRDSQLVIRGTILSSEEIAEKPSIPDSEPGVLYRIRVDQVFKGNAPKELSLYTERDSGGFYTDIGKQYLLFLNPIEHNDWARKVAPGAMRVNYNCGRSRDWREVPDSDRQQLNALAAKPQNTP